MRRPGFVTPATLLKTLLLFGFMALAAPAAAFQIATPAASTPVSPPPPTAAAPPASTPAPTPASAQSDVVALVYWYQQARDRDILELYPVKTDQKSVASPGELGAAVGSADFPAEGVPRVVAADTTFDAYPRPDGSIERWTWFDDFEGARPATLVIEMSGLEGRYVNYYGTATFVSRDTGGAGGVLVIMLRPPAPAAATPAAAEPTP
jgi:hypothetical protein